MNQYGILGRYLPAFGRIVGQMQHDLYHVYTVDEHILMVVRNLRRFTEAAARARISALHRLIANFERPGCCIWRRCFTTSPRAAAATTRARQPPTRGASAATMASPRRTRDLVVWLVEQHLTMSPLAQKQDIGDPEVIARLRRKVRTPRRL